MLEGSIGWLKKALNQMKPMKAPGPDGYHPVFFQKMWDIVGEDVCQNIRSWFSQRKLPKEMCHAVICLIPKQHPPETVKHLRPISLCNTLYKLATKVLVNRLKPLIPYWISPNQNSFIKGRGPEVNIVVASEILHSLKRKKGKMGWFALKIDLEKAYDRIEWSFVRKCLQNLDLSDASIELIMSCVSQSSSSILINGRKTESFNHSRGLRQGDPMSPYLFNICLEALSQMINQATLDKKWTPFWVGKDKVPVSHLMFADDLLIFGRVDEDTAFEVRKILQEFCRISGQKINESKSRLIFSPNTPRDHKELFQHTLNIEENEDLGTYLGLPLSHKRPSRSQVQFVVDKVKKKLANWKTKFLSRAGRLCLITSTLATIPAYYMQATFLPATTLQDLDRVCNNFLWGGQDGENKIHLVGKEKTFTPKEHGGLGIRNQTLMNKAYMAKLGWKLSQGPDNLAQKCITSKYVHKNYVTSFRKGSPVWQSVGKGWELLANNSQWILRNGESINFWGDDWLGIGPIREACEGPLNKHESEFKVKDVSIDGNWNLQKLSIKLPDSIINRILDLEAPKEQDQQDTLTPLFLSPEGFSLSTAYKAQILGSGTPDIDWVWDIHTSPKIQFFFWLVCQDRLPHGQLLSDRHINISNQCTRCTQEIENSHHILRTCPHSLEVWALVPPCTNQRDMNSSQWIKSNLGGNLEFRNIAWPILFPFLCYEIWKSRNHRVFNPNVPPLVAATVVAQACRNARDFVHATSSSRQRKKETRGPSLMDHTPNSWTMLNVDASFHSHLKPSGMGGVFRNNIGEWLLGYTKNTYARDALLAELKGIQAGLSTALDHGFKNLVLFSDCKKATQLLDQVVTHANIYANVIGKCRELSTKFDNLKVLHCSREHNQLADMMAKHRSKSSELAPYSGAAEFFISPPSYCMNKYLAECIIREPSMASSYEMYDSSA